MPPSAAQKQPAGSAAARGQRSGRLSVADWTEKALELLMSEGIGAVKIARLCTELGVTKGSFYWHFANLEDLMEAIATRWRELTRESLSGLSDLDRLPPIERLQRMTDRLLDDRSWAVERALRDWARSDDRVAEAVDTSDRYIFELVRQALLDLGFDAGQARLRAGTLVYAGIGFAHGQASLPKPSRSDVDELLALLAQP